MGGQGSGRWYRWHSKDTIEGRQSLDVREWQRRGWLHAGARFEWYGFTMHAQPGWVRLSYRLQRETSEGQDVDEPIPLSWTACNYDGRRPWFCCPGWGCGRRVAKPYLGNRYFLCRRCHDLAYESQREDYATRMISRPQKVRRRLGGSASLMEPFPPKLRYMRWHVYSQLYLKAQRAEEAGMQAALAQLQRMYSRSGMGKHGHDRLCWVSHPLTEHRLA